MMNNQKIRDLAFQAGAGEWGDSVVPAMMDIEKFAELLIKECGIIADEYKDEHLLTFPSEEMKRYFGVE